MLSSRGCIFVLIWAYSQVAQAYTKFEPECTNPKEAVNFVSSPPTRGTLDILWSSLFTIFACTWSVLHLNVPQQRVNRDPGILGDLKWGIKTVLSKTKWMLYTVLAPEVLLLYAVARLVSAWEQHPEIKAFADADRVPWTLAHTTFADMGGFVVRGRSDRIGGVSPGSEMPTAPIQTQVNESDPISDYANEWYILDLKTIRRLRSEGHITLPCILKAEIDDHSKGDTFTKVIAATQIIWTIANAITRACRGLAISQLEVSVVAFAVCALLIYASYWYSPKDVSVPITFLQWRGPVPSTIAKIIVKGVVSTRPKRYVGVKTGQAPFRNTFAYDNKSRLDVYTLFWGAFFFGGPHLLAWNFTFPTPAERIIWRATSLYLDKVAFCEGAQVAVYGILAHALALEWDSRTERYNKDSEKESK
ncbi:hypothetical protein V499_04666 [Pseudogymnoascus sp. VKM F-103]|nr:hypothetical protein V499_04666 [Pseudogymnoascus sp. VKM F-103]